MKVSKLTPFIALFDIHIGFERIRHHGKELIRPTHSLPAIRAMMKFAKDFKPEALILGGDQLNCGPISHWLKGKPRLTAGFNLRKEMDLLDEIILRPFDALLPKGAPKIWHDGNHEVWIQDHIDQNPGTEGLLEPKNYLKLAERGYKIFDQGEVSSLGKLNFVHSDVVLRNGSTVNPAKTLVNAYRKNIRGGHLHTYSSAIDTTLVDARDYHSGIIVPSLSTRNPAFMKNNPSNSCMGFDFGWILPNGNFTDYIVVMSHNTFIYNGKLYDGNK